MVLDQQGWSDVSDLLDGALDRLIEIQAEASKRSAAAGEAGTLAKVHLMHFKSPTPDELKKTEAAAASEAKPAAS